jgi:predicted secreted hydrolase
MWIASGAPAAAQGFSGLGADAKEFALPDPGHHFDFSQGHGPKPDFRTKGRCVTANLARPDDTDCRIPWTLARSALRPVAGQRGWTGQRHLFATDLFGRKDAGLAGDGCQPS